MYLLVISVQPRRSLTACDAFAKRQRQEHHTTNAKGVQILQAAAYIRPNDGQGYFEGIAMPMLPVVDKYRLEPDPDFCFLTSLARSIPTAATRSYRCPTSTSNQSSQSNHNQ